ncbi:MAG: type II toxin-antitoxin system VapC family toxin [Gracilimonas sp.]|jgi:predicted nucleic acid-binding protein|uniref:type II toxin-antitoxin system VapC family toxin n=1 Tax=Gracilimonas sp. TaxID=1974203 RepID=UPI003752BF15|nr:type II toxin-antitoxin system VapC family toxin [Gracilimonas sp.]
MNLLLDTNVILYYLAGNQRLALLLDGVEVSLSFISVVELLSYPDIETDEEEKIQTFLSECTIISESEPIRTQTILIRRKFNLKVPDAFVAATSIERDIPLLSADKNFSKVEDLLFIDFEI